MSVPQMFQRSHDTLHLASNGESVRILRVQTKHIRGYRDEHGEVVYDVWETDTADDKDKP